MKARESSFSGGGDPVHDDLSDDGELRISEHAGIVAWCPAIPPFSGTVRLAPETADARLDSSTDYVAVAGLLAEVIRRIDVAFDRPAMNVMMHQRRPGGPDSFHWHLDLLPRLGTLAGLELGTGVMAIAQAPRTMADRLRSV